MHRAVLLVTGILIASGCRSSSPYRPIPPRTSAQRYPIHIDSRHWDNVVVYAVRMGERREIGTVFAGQDRTLLISADLFDTDGLLHLLARPLANRGTFSADPVLVHPGEYVLWTIEDAPARSHIAVYQLRAPVTTNAAASTTNP